MRARALLLLVLLQAPLLGCLGDEPAEGARLAERSHLPPTVPQQARNDTPEPVDEGPRINLTDPGYVMREAWDKGDLWYYETAEKLPRFRRVEIIEKAQVGNTTMYLVEEFFGQRNSSTFHHLVLEVDGTNWTRLSARGDHGMRLTFEPPALDLRFYRNGTFEYNESGRSEYVPPWRDRHIVNSHYAANERVPLPWGESLAARVEHRDLVIDGAQQQKKVLLIHWADRTYRNDVAFEYNGLRYVLVAARVGSTVYGELPPRPQI